jgi:hypothetical protein
MKMLVLLLLLFGSSLNSISQQSFQSHLSGRVLSSVNKVYLRSQEDDIVHVDSAVVRNNQFSIKKKLFLPQVAVFYTDKQHSPIHLFLENGSYIFTIAKDSIKVVKPHLLLNNISYLYSSMHVFLSCFLFMENSARKKIRLD